MRITTEQKEIILSTVHKIYGNNVNIWLFGSRAEDSKRGGDIDLYLEAKCHDPFMLSIRCKSELQDRLDLDVDLLVADDEQEHPICTIARQQGIPL